MSLDQRTAARHDRVSPPAARRWVLLAVVTALVLAGGGWRAWASMHPADSAGVRAVIVGQQATSRVGLVTVTGVEFVDGLTDEDLGGMSHGVTGLVDAEHTMARVTVLLRSPGAAAAAAITPADFAVRVSSTAELVRPVGGSMQTTQLAAGEQVEGSLGFVVPRDGSSLVLQLVDGLSPPVTVYLGRVGVAVPGTETHSH